MITDAGRRFLRDGVVELTGGELGAQLELELNDCRKVLTPEPWDGQSPRALTQAYLKFSLGAHPGRVLRP